MRTESTACLSSSTYRARSRTVDLSTINGAIDSGSFGRVTESDLLRVRSRVLLTPLLCSDPVPIINSPTPF